MRGVSYRLISAIIENLDDAAPLDGITEGFDLRPEILADRKGQMPWPDFVVLMSRIEKHLGSPQAIRQFGASVYSTKSMRALTMIGRWFLSPRDLYVFGAQWVGPRLFPAIRAQVFEPSDDYLVQRLILHEGYEDCPVLFEMFRGTLEDGPTAFGFRRSRVEAQIEPGRGTYHIFPAGPRHSRIGRTIRALRAPFTMPKVLGELIEQQIVIESNYDEIRRARDRIELQTADLERVNSIGRKLSQKIDLEHVADVLVRVLIEEIGVDGVELWLSRPESDAQLRPPEEDETNDLVEPPRAEISAEPRLYRRGGLQSGLPTRSLLLETAAGPLGTLKVWIHSDDSRSPQQLMLTRLLPWISMSLDNARSYESLQHHASALEQRVKERTARLLAANHHLVKEIGERKKATEALLESENQRRAAERLASVGTLAAGIAHEINNPIGAILAAAQLALLTTQDENQSADPDELALVLGDIIAQAKRCGGIVRSVLQFSRDERTEKWRCDLPESIQRGVRLADRLAQDRGTRIAMDLPTGDVVGIANPIQIEQAVVNLVINAIEASAQHISIEAAVREAENELLVTITDDGPGLGETEEHRLLEPFYTTRREDGGTGLGLSVVHGIIEEHGGTLRLDTRAEGGTRAQLRLPLTRVDDGA